MITKSQLIHALGSAAALGRMAEVTRQAVVQWGEKIPVTRCRTIERNSENRWTVHDLRPDIFGPALVEPVPMLGQDDAAPTADRRFLDRRMKERRKTGLVDGTDEGQTA